MTDLFKSQIWEHITKHYIVDDCYKKSTFQRVGKLWRDHRSRTVTKIKTEVALVGLEAVAAKSKPNNVQDPKAWIRFLRYRLSAACLKTSQDFKKKRAKKTLVHTTSRKSLANVEHELKEKSKEPEKITRSDVWLEAYGTKKTNDTECVEDVEIVWVEGSSGSSSGIFWWTIEKQVRLKRLEETSSQNVQDDAVCKVLGAERRGRVRGYGFGALPSRVPGQAYTGSKVTRLEQELHGMTKLGETEESNESASVTIYPVGNASSRTDAQLQGLAMTKQNKKRKQIYYEVGGVDQEAGHAHLLKKLHLLSWLDGGKTVVAAADLQSEDPTEKVHCLPVGEGNWKVWVHEVYNDIPLIRPTSEFTKLSDAKGCILAWPVPFIKKL